MSYGDVRLIRRVSARRRSARGDRGPLVVVAGIPGAGKSAALLAVAAAEAGPVTLDSAQVERWLRTRMRRLPYPTYRPLVHATHWARIAGRAVTHRGPLVVHETATRALSRAALFWLARIGRRRIAMVWLEVPAEVAVAGQASRGRMVGRRSFGRHLGRVGRRHPAQAAARNWDMVSKTDRAGVVPAVMAACSNGSVVGGGSEGGGPAVGDGAPVGQGPPPDGPAQLVSCVRGQLRS